MANQSVELYFAESGQGFPLLLVHGFPLDHTIWDEVAGLLGADARVIRPDLRGFGRSPVTEGVYGMPLLANDLLALIDRLGLEKVVLAGHSMGGYAGLAFARAYPQRLAGLALVTSQAAADLPERRAARLQQAKEVEQNGMAVIEAGLARYSPDAAVRERARQIVAKAEPRAVAGCLRGMAERPDLSDFLREVRVPALVIAGEVDELIASRNSQAMVDLLPQGQLVMVKGGGHMAMMESPQVVAEALRDLVQRAQAVS